MRKIFVLIVVALVATLSFSCQQKTVTVEKSTKTTVSQIGSTGFIIKKVIKGDTVWGYSEEVYGTGVEWREIVAENPFLNQPGRVYYDQGREKWIVILFPGESIRIKGQVVTPTFVSEETSTTTSTETVGVPWWGWLIIAVGGIIFLFFLLGTIGLISFRRCYRPLNCCPAPCPCPVPCPPAPDPAMPSVSYNSSANGEKRARVEGARETVITHSSNGEMTVTARQ